MAVISPYLLPSASVLSQEKTLDHLFLFCPSAQHASFSLFAVFDLACCLPEKVDLWLLEYFGGEMFRGKAKILRGCAVRVTFWLSWKERNQRIF